jgi:predicted transcriptional regulator
VASSEWCESEALIGAELVDSTQNEVATANFDGEAARGFALIQQRLDGRQRSGAIFSDGRAVENAGQCVTSARRRPQTVARLNADDVSPARTMTAAGMTIRDDVHHLIDELPETDLADARALLEELRVQERAAEALAEVRDQAIEEWQRDAVREGIAYAARDDAEWVAHEDMTAWLRSWGTDHELPPPPAHRRV